MGVAKSSAMKLEFELMRIYRHPFAIARTLYQALVDQDPDRAITLCDSSGRVVTHHYPQPEQSSPENAS
jgi:hypothetical protein